MARRRASEWRRLVGQWQKSGLTARGFADEQGVAPTTLTWWRWRLRSEQRVGQQQRGRTKRAAGRDRSPRDAAVALVRVVAAEPAARTPVAAEPPVELVLGDVVVRVRRGFDAETLGRVIDVLEAEEPRSC